MSRDVERDALAMFASDVRNHRMIVKLDHGIYRHVVFQQPEHSWNARFELITTPGQLTISGDHGTFTFRREYDMFGFFRSNVNGPHRINTHYWSEKLPDGRDSVTVYSEEVTRSLIDEHLNEATVELGKLQKEYDEENQRQLDEWLEDQRAEGIQEENLFTEGYGPPPKDDEWPELLEARKLVADAREAIKEHEEWGSGLAFAEGARELLQELERLSLVADTWEWDLTDWDFHFVWCLHALAWGIQQYDRAVRDGLHVRHTAPIPQAVPLPTVAPAKPEPVKPKAEARPIEVLATVASI